MCVFTTLIRAKHVRRLLKKLKKHGFDFFCMLKKSHVTDNGTGPTHVVSAKRSEVAA